ncbi:basic salivary proline-rich protein 2-like [Canis lupus familiaris]|uniref:basic salivary proline-rich protein 2-like n=1 Tax=Canis lupus familiaris TaxID=9615 RepID=UPI0018F44D1C|nr:basic salivary proline-rich protein 2-like [Canis lupus familiaris]
MAAGKPAYGGGEGGGGGGERERERAAGRERGRTPRRPETPGRARGQGTASGLGPPPPSVTCGGWAGRGRVGGARVRAGGRFRPQGRGCRSARRCPPKPGGGVAGLAVPLSSPRGGRCEREVPACGPEPRGAETPPPGFFRGRRALCVPRSRTGRRPLAAAAAAARRGPGLGFRGSLTPGARGGACRSRWGRPRAHGGRGLEDAGRRKLGSSCCLRAPPRRSSLSLEQRGPPPRRGSCRVRTRTEQPRAGGMEGRGRRTLRRGVDSLLGRPPASCLLPLLPPGPGALRRERAAVSAQRPGPPPWPRRPLVPPPRHPGTPALPLGSPSCR